jgi:hypothetical protein
MPDAPHTQSGEAINCLWVADVLGVSVFAKQAPEFAEDHSEDTVIVVLRGREAVTAGREALIAVAKLVQEGSERPTPRPRGLEAAS